MIDYKHQKLIYKYQLDTEMLPEKLREGIRAFKIKMSDTIRSGNPEALSLLAEIDDQIALQILSWIEENEEDLSSIVNPTAIYKEFYLIVYSILSKEGYYSGTLYGYPLDMQDEEIISYVITPIQGSFGCVFFYFTIFKTDDFGNAPFQKFVIKVCESSKTIEPVYFEIPDEDLEVYNYLSNGTEPNHTNKEIVDLKFKELLNELMDAGVFFIKDPMKLIVNQLRIAENSK